MRTKKKEKRKKKKDLATIRASAQHNFGQKADLLKQFIGESSMQERTLQHWLAARAAYWCHRPHPDSVQTCHTESLLCDTSGRASKAEEGS
jgi:hypothetical protein